MAQIKVKYSGEKQICFCDAANDKALPFTKADLRNDRRERLIDDGPWVRAWLASCPDLSIVDEAKAAEVKPEPKPEPVAQKPEPPKYNQQAYKKGPKGNR
jgi:hypothetical protein